jgi:hypothetical protein
MKIRTIIAAVAAPLALGGVLLTATAASASPLPPGPTTTITVGSTDPMNPQVLSGPINSKVDVPAGKYASVQWGEVAGNVTVEGSLSASAAIFDRNVAVSGPGSELSLFSYPSEIKGNLSVTGSSGVQAYGNQYMPGKSFGNNATQVVGDPTSAAGRSKIDGNFSFDYNTGGLAAGPLDVSGNFEASNNGPYPNGLGIVNNPGWFDLGSLTAAHISVS